MPHIATTYLLQGCPFSFKFLLFITEAGLLDVINVIELVHDVDGYNETKAMLSDKLGQTATFPTVEVEPDQFMSDSDVLIKYFAEKYLKDIDALRVVPFYERGVMSKLMESYMENRQYKEKYGAL